MATPIWIGAAGPTLHVETITIANVWTTGDTVTLACGGSTLTVTAGAAVATSDIAAALNAAINASDKTTGLIGDETRSAGGQTLPEFVEIASTVSGSVVTLTSKIAGLPFVTAASEVTAGTGTATRAVAVEATGPNHFDNAENWLSGVLPANGDTIRFDRGTVSCSHGLTYLVDNTLACNLVVTTDYTGRLGLLPTRVATANNGTYPDYRAKQLALYDVGSAKTIQVITGENGGAGGVYGLNLTDFAGAAITIDDAGSIGSEPSVVLLDGSSTSMYIGTGWVAIDPHSGGLTSGHALGALIIGGRTGSVSSPKVTLGALTTFTGTIATTINAGLVDAYCAWDQGSAETTLTILGGIVTGHGAQAHLAVAIQGGTYRFAGSGSMAGAVTVWDGATLDLRNSGQAQTYAGGVTLYGGSTLHKGGHTLTPSFVGCTADNCTITS